MPFERNTHHTVKTREGTVDGRVTPHLLLTSDQGQMIIQGGEWYDAGGVSVDEVDVPDWAWEAAKKLSAETRYSLGLEPLAEADAVEAKVAARRPSINVDAPQGNTPMQLNADGPSGEAKGQADPVPQGNEVAPKAVAKGPPPPLVKK